MTSFSWSDPAQPIERFPTVDEMRTWAAELAYAHPDTVTLRNVGASRDGDVIQLLSVTGPGDGPDVLVIGQPHPNEPIGMATITALAARLASDPDAVAATGVKWHFLPCADPDGTRLNEGWFAGPWTREFYARHFYRPGGAQQVEWTFPFATDGFTVDAPMPETRSLMAAIDLVRPRIAASLHNGEMGGAYFYAGEGAPDLYRELAALCVARGIPLHRGEPETSLSIELAPSVFTVPTAQQMYDLATSVGMDPATLVSGASSLEYALRYGEVFPIVVELPYWRDARADDMSPDPLGRTRREVTLDAVELHESAARQMRKLMAVAAPLPPSPFLEAVDAFLRIDESGFLESRRHEATTDPEFNRPATVADVFSAFDSVHLSRLRLGGMLLRAIPAENPACDDVRSVFDEWAAEAAADSKAEPIPIMDLVGVQAAAILATVEHVVGA